jgi:hypothetical protein
MEYGGCESGCPCCSGEDMKALNELLQERVAQIIATDDDARDEADESNPIIYAEGGPNRFALMSLFFTDSDGVRIEEDLSTGEITVNYFTDSEELEVKEGALYEWAINYYRDNY